MGKILRGEELRKRAEQLGVSQNETYDHRGIQSEPELQRRVIEAERHRRDASMWIIALLSALASIVSAIAAWMAVLTKSGN